MLISPVPHRPLLSCYVAALDETEAKDIVVNNYNIHPIAAKSIIVEPFDFKTSQLLKDTYNKKYTHVERGPYHQLSPETTKSILLEYISGLLGDSELSSQSYISAKYQCSQGTVNRTIKNTAMRYTSMFVEDLNNGITYDELVKTYDFVKPEYIKMTMLYSFQRMTSDDTSYYEIAKKHGILDFAKTLVGTPANRYSV